MSLHDHLVLPEEVRKQLQRYARSRTTPHRLVVRSRIVLLAAARHSSTEIARTLGVSAPTVRLWLSRFRAGGIEALLRDAKGRGRRRSQQVADLHEKLSAVVRASHGSGTQTIRSLAGDFGSNPATVWRTLRRLRSRNSSK